MALSLGSDEGTEAGTEAARELGVVTNLAILGPFRDTGGGLDAAEGPEGTDGSFANQQRTYSWGAMDVRWVKVPPHYAWASGLPLDLFVSPRTESCSIVATDLVLEQAETVRIRLASSGSARLMFDGRIVARSADAHQSAVADRLAAEVSGKPGHHLVAAKVCTGALGDEGRVRLRLTGPGGARLHGKTSADLSLVGIPGGTRAGDARKRDRPSPPGLSTPLSRTLAPSLRSVPALLAEGIARTLGGADDTRSPRAPGLMDDLARRATGLTADDVAMIGWVSPSGANRGSVLHRAVALAGDLDPRTRVFAERRLIAERVHSHLVDWAVATAHGIHLGRADAEAVLLHALLADALGTEALRLEALRDLEAFARAKPEKAPTALLQEEARLAGSFDPGVLRTALEALATRGNRGHEYVQVEGTRSADALAVAAKAAFDGQLTNASDGLAVVEALSRAGRHEEARVLYTQMAEWAPNRSEA